LSGHLIGIKIPCCTTEADVIANNAFDSMINAVLSTNLNQLGYDAYKKKLMSEGKYREG
jgi:hypothetical protein